MEDSLYIDLEPTHYLPGQRIAGKILWALAKPPKELSLTLIWFTEGRGSTDRKLEAEQTWSTEATSGEENFEFTLPASPYSFEGKLISLHWELQLRPKKGKGSCELPILVSPHPHAIEL
jgi:hypothetical protein